MIISSRQNPIVKRLKELREAKGRAEQKAFLIDGSREMERAIDKGIEITAVYFCRDFSVDPVLMEKIWQLQKDSSKKVEFMEFGKSAFETVCYRENPIGLVLEAKIWSTEIKELGIKNPTLLILAEDIEKPGNLGTLLRTADAVGAQAIIGCNKGVDLFNPNTLRASAGAAFSVPYAIASRQEALDWLRQNKVKVVATSPAAQKPLWEADLRQPVAIAMGSEAWGLSRELLSAADEIVSLPMKGIGDSLNVSVATGAILYEVLRQRR